MYNVSIVLFALYSNKVILKKKIKKKKNNCSGDYRDVCALIGRELCHIYLITVEPRFNEPLFNEVLDISNDIISMSRPKLQ